MNGVYNANALILNATQIGMDSSSNTLTIAADLNEYWVLQKIWVSQDSSGSADFDTGSLKVGIDIFFTDNLRLWELDVHRGNQGTGSLEFISGPWEYNFNPGLYRSVKNEALKILVGAFGSGIKSTINILYQ